MQSNTDVIVVALKSEISQKHTAELITWEETKSCLSAWRVSYAERRVLIIFRVINSSENVFLQNLRSNKNIYNLYT